MAARALRKTSAPRTRIAEPADDARLRVERAKSIGSLDRLIHDRVRLGILSALASIDSISFTDLKSALELSDGNLSVHARKLEDAGYINCTKSFDGRTPRTEFSIAPAGRRAFEKYLDHMDALISAARKAKS
jgi:DNA-binding transcriptional ArsR family regulator